MKTSNLLMPAALFVLSGCASGPSAEEQAAPLAEARQASAALTQTLGGELKAAIAARGLDGAVGVCKERAPQIAASVSQQFKVDARRVSARNRNPAAVPDVWEAQAIAGLEKAAAAGSAPAALETWAVVETSRGRQFRYALGLPVQPLCLGCHGDPATLSPAVKARLAADYPQDKATGYGLGMLRGIVSVQRPI